MPRYVMAIEAEKCTNCKACIIACQQRNELGYGHSRNWVRAARDNASPSGFSYQPGSCMQCDAPLCVEACPTKATYKDIDGVVRIDEQTCIGCGSCIRACPYDARHRDPIYGTADKCEYCTASRGQGLAPACVQACATKVRVFGDADDPADPVAKILARRTVTLVQSPSPPDRGTKPTQVYLGKTGPVDWPRRAELPVPVELMGTVATAIRWIGSLSLLGIVGVLCKQLVLPSDAGAGADPDQPGTPGNKGKGGES